MVGTVKKEIESNEQHRSSPRRVCRRLWLGERHQLLKQDGYSVSVVQNSTISLEDDVAVTKRALSMLDVWEAEL